MRKKLLAAVSAEDRDFYGLRFLADFIGNKEETGVTLFHVAQNPGLTASDARTARELGRVVRQQGLLREKGEIVLGEAENLLARAGFPQENITRKLKFLRYGVVPDIVVEGGEGQYDAMVLGRRAASLFDALVRDSVGKALIELPLAVPIWINRWFKAGRKNVLVCADGSEESLRAADHAGFMLADDPGCEIHILHIHNPAREDPLESEAVVAGAKAAVLGAGASEARVASIIRRGAGYARIIMEEAKRGNYAAVVVGFTGADRTPWRKLFMGSTTLSLLRNLDAAALWVAH